MAGPLARLWWLPFGKVPEIDADALAAALASDAPPLLLDVRSAAEHRRSRIHGSIHAPITELAARLHSLDLEPGRPIVAICLSAHRSVPAVRLLRARGLDAVQLAGGMRSWWARSLPTEGEG
ncbi:MAG: rhodanese-like domain-containing protein [Myxococcales bacterium]|nr:rhodanese-like domain-containing protein [Myxococcales bacterium]MCB9703761.1 rhodanese-like domain-containing protein [Myxococcales bacterium]